MKIKFNKQTGKNVSDNLLSVNYVKDGESFQIKTVDVNFDTLTPEQKTLINNFIALLEAKTV